MVDLVIAAGIVRYPSDRRRSSSFGSRRGALRPPRENNPQRRRSPPGYIGSRGPMEATASLYPTSQKPPLSAAQA